MQRCTSKQFWSCSDYIRILVNRAPNVLMPSIYSFAVWVRVPLFIVDTPNALAIEQKGSARQVSRQSG